MKIVNRIQFLLQRVRQFGEPIVSGLDPATLDSELSDIGLRLIEDVGPEQVQTRFLDQGDGFQSTEYWHLARSVIAKGL